MTGNQIFTQHSVRLRIPTTEEWDYLMNITHEDNAVTNWLRSYSWVYDQTYEAQNPLRCAVRGYISACNRGDTDIGNQSRYIGFRPAFEYLGDDSLKDGTIVTIGTLYMNGKAVRVSQDTAWGCNVKDFLPNATLTIGPTLRNSAYTIHAIKIGNVYIADRVLLKNISCRDIKDIISSI